MREKKTMSEEKDLSEDALAGVTGGHDHGIGGIVDTATNGGIVNNTTSSSADGAMPYDGGYAGKGRNSSHITNE